MGDASISIAGLGDSLTHGWCVRVGFFDRAIDMLRDSRNDLNICAQNLGISGDTASGGLSRLGSILHQGHDIVTVQFAINDCYSGQTVQRFTDHYVRITEQIGENGALPVLVTSCPLFDDEEMIAPYYEAIRATARVHGAPLADLDRYWRDHASSAATDLFLDDRVHPTDAGHTLMARGLHEVLSSVVSS